MKHVILALFSLVGVARCYDYDKVLRLSLLFYEAQRSGHLPASNRIPWRGDSAIADKGQNGEDLSGGYYDGNGFITAAPAAAPAPVPAPPPNK